MKTLILEDDPLRARGWIAHFGGATDVIHVARTPAQARLMLLATAYDRFCLCFSAHGAARFALLSVARAINPACEIVDLTSRRRRLATGPMTEAAESPAKFTR